MAGAVVQTFNSPIETGMRALILLAESILRRSTCSDCSSTTI